LSHSRFFRALSGVVVIAAVAYAPLPAQVTPSFTVEQAQNGRRVYSQNCQSCHGIGLADGPFGPPLKGPEFRENWFGKSADALFIATKSTMPPAARGSLRDDQYVEVVALMLAENGVPPGDSPLAADVDRLHAIFLPWVPPVAGAEIRGGVTIPAPPTRPDPIEALTPVTEAMLEHPPAGEWLTWRRTWDSQGFSPLDQITRANVQSLRLKWVWSLPPGPNEGTPLFHDGVLFVQSFRDKVQAFDAVSGDLLWQFSHQARERGPSVKRNIALYEDRVYLATSDTHVVAISAKTGRPIWDRAIPKDKTEMDFVITSGPLVARGKVMVGMAGAAPGGNFIAALDAETGEPEWRVYTVARPGEPGGNSWNGLPLDKRNGASVWVAGSYDPALNLAFFGTAQTYDTGPLREPSSDSAVTRDALYTDSTLAINPDTGKIVWHFQHQPNDQWDLDWALEQVLLKLPGAPKTLVATAGKQGIYDVMEADTGRYVFSIDLGLQDVVTAIDPRTGAKTVDPSKIPGRQSTVSVCPHSGGAKSWIPESFNPATHTMFVPLNESCMDLVPVPVGGRTMLSSGVRWRLKPRADSDGKYGRLQAIDFETRKIVWTVRQRAPIVTGALATAGGVVFAGALDRVFAAYDDSSGRELWRVRLNDVPNAAPITFMAGGRQYVALTVGNGGAMARAFPMLVPEVRNPTDTSAAMYVFELPAR
jgi:PQQ-dependent dehydrogenase (methanol/ethanol family)